MSGIPNERIISISSFIEAEGYQINRELLISSVVMPFHYLWLPNLRHPRIISKSNLVAMHDTILSSYVSFPNADSPFNQSLCVLLDIKSPSIYGRFKRESFFRVWRTLAKIDLNVRRDVRNWLIESIRILPSDIAYVPKRGLCQPALAYATMLLMLASYGEYPMWICDKLGHLDAKQIPDSPEMWAKRYMNTVLDHFENVRRRVNRNISRSMDPFDLTLYYLGTFCGMCKYPRGIQHANIASLPL